MKDQKAYVGLRSGGVLIVTKGEGGVPTVDASQVTLYDVAYGIVGQNRFANQLYRQPYTVLEHSLLGTYMLDNPEHGIQFLFHDTSEGFGLCDLNWKIKTMFGQQVKRVEKVMLEALAPKFHFTYPHDSEIKDLDRTMGAYELVSLHPAAGKVAEGYGFTLDELRTKPSVAQRGVMDRWFNRPPASLDVQVTRWIERLETLRGIARDRKATEVIEPYLRQKGVLPVFGSFLVQQLSKQFNLPHDLVREELVRLFSQGVLVNRMDYVFLKEEYDVALHATTPAG